MAEAINLTVDRREDMFLQVYWTDLNDVPFYLTGGFLDASSGATKILSSDPADAGDNTKYAAYDISVLPVISSELLSIDSASGLVTVSVPYSVVSTWSAGTYSYALVVKYTASVTSAESYRKVLMTGNLVVV